MLNKISHTQISNDFIDKYMNVLSGEAVKIFIAISRKTIGWHKDCDRISYSQLLKLTGIKSVNGLKKGIKQLLDNFLIKQEKIQDEKSNIKIYYEINYISQYDTLSQNDIVISESVSQNDIDNTKTLSRNDSTKDINIKKQYKEIEEIYNSYPTKDFINNRSTSKSGKDKLKIAMLLKQKSKQELLKIIETYITECKQTKTFIKNFSTFLNNLPDINAIIPVNGFDIKSVEHKSFDEEVF